MGGMNISSVGAGGYEPSRQVGAARQEQKALVEALREEREGQPDVAEMMKEAREKAAEREKMFKRPKSSRRAKEAVHRLHYLPKSHPRCNRHQSHLPPEAKPWHGDTTV